MTTAPKSEIEALFLKLRRSWGVKQTFTSNAIGAFADCSDRVAESMCARGLASGRSEKPVKRGDSRQWKLTDKGVRVVWALINATKDI